MKNIKLLLLSAGLVLPLISGCKIFKPSSNSGNQSNNSQTSSEGSSTTEVFRISNPNYDCPIRANKDEVQASDLFNLKNKVSIEIDIDRSELQKIEDDNDYDQGNKPEIYHLVNKVTISLKNGNNTFTWEIPNVGIKQKGNTSREHIFSETGLNKNHFKLSFDETFTDTAKYDAAFIQAHGDAELKGREFLGLTGLDIKWDKNDDQTHLKEIYSSMMLRSAGIITQRIGLTTMKINYDTNKVADFGLCYLYEQNNRELVKNALKSEQRFINMQTWAEEKVGTHGEDGKKYGDLYKASYGRGTGSNYGGDMTTDSISGSKVGLKTDIQGYNYPAYERKTHKDASYNDSAFKSIINTLNKNNATYSEIANVVDLQYFAMEEAVMYFLGNPDSMRYNYNNYMIYLRRTDGKMVIIPIDNDRNLGTGNSWTYGLDFVLSNDATPLSKVTTFGEERNPLFLKTILANSDNQAKKDYKKCLELVKNSEWVKKETFAAYFNILKETYKDLATFNLDGGYENISFESYMNTKMRLYNGGQGGQTTSETSEPEGSSEAPEALFPDNHTYKIIGFFNSWGNHPAAEEDMYTLKRHSNGHDFFLLYQVVTEEEWNPGQIQVKIISDDNIWYCADPNNANRFIKEPLDGAGEHPGLMVDAARGDLLMLRINIETGEVNVNATGSSTGYMDDFSSLTLVGIEPVSFVQIDNLTAKATMTVPDSFTSESTPAFIADAKYVCYYKLRDNNQTDDENDYWIDFSGCYEYSTFEIPIRGAKTIELEINRADATAVIHYYNA